MWFNGPGSTTTEREPMNPKTKRWLIFGVVLFGLMAMWTTMAAASAPSLHSETQQSYPIPSLIGPGYPTFEIVLGAVVIVAIIVSTTFLQIRNKN